MGVQHLKPIAEDPAYWNTYYEQRGFASESSFARWIRGQLSQQAIVIDLGCGDGRDAAFFANCGHTVVAVDRAASAIARAKSKLHSGISDRVRFHVGDVANETVASNVAADIESLRHISQPVAIYLRFFLHAVPLNVETSMLDWTDEKISAPVVFAAEFRTHADATLPKAEPNHFRRFIRPEEFAKRLVYRGFTIAHMHQGRGLSVYRGEDPHLCRLVATRA
jgi:SAM-dependent methyltransferase